MGNSTLLVHREVSDYNPAMHVRATVFLKPSSNHYEEEEAILICRGGASSFGHTLLATSLTHVLSVMNASPPKETMRRKIYWYSAPWCVYSMNWNVRQDKQFYLAIRSFVEDNCNKVSLSPSLLLPSSPPPLPPLPPSLPSSLPPSLLPLFLPLRARIAEVNYYTQQNAE